jgi:hypothetical protein
MEKIVEFNPAYDKRHSDPSKDYGVHGVDIKFVLKGEKGVTQFLLFTNWQLPHITEKNLAKFNSPRDIRLFFTPMPAGLGYHSKEPLPYHDTPTSTDCEYTGGDCYYDGSGLNAERVYDVLLHEGDKGVWRELELYYKDIFGDDVNGDN